MAIKPEPTFINTLTNKDLTTVVLEVHRAEKTTQIKDFRGKKSQEKLLSETQRAHSGFSCSSISAGCTT